MVSEGRVLYAWDRPLRASNDPSDQIRATLLPGEPGWGCSPLRRRSGRTTSAAT